MDRMNAPFAPDDAEAERIRLERPPSEARWVDAKDRPWNLVIPHTVYPPREDTDLLAGWLAKQGPGHGRSVFEVGVGSGAIMLQMAADGWDVSGCDVHPYAVAATRHALSSHGYAGRIHEADVGDLDASLLAKADLVVWNTPYLPPIEDGQAHLGPLEEAGLSDPDAEGSGHALLARLDDNPVNATLRAALVVQERAVASLRRDATLRGWTCSTVARLAFEDGEQLRLLIMARAWPGATSGLVASTGSTNADLMEGARNTGDSLRAEEQINGRGRREATWWSGPGDLTGSWVLFDGEGPLPPHGLLQAACALATRDALVDLGCDESEHLLLKWPNDLLLDREAPAKIGGWLIESRQHGRNTRIVAGLGLNLTEGPAHVDGTPRAFVQGTTAAALHAALSARLSSRLADLASTDGRRLMAEEAVLAYRASARRLGMTDSDGNELVPISMDEHGGLRLEGGQAPIHDLDAVLWRSWP